MACLFLSLSMEGASNGQLELVGWGHPALWAPEQLLALPVALAGLDPVAKCAADWAGPSIKAFPSSAVWFRGTAVSGFWPHPCWVNAAC